MPWSTILEIALAGIAALSAVAALAARADARRQAAAAAESAEAAQLSAEMAIREDLRQRKPQLTVTYGEVERSAGVPRVGALIRVDEPTGYASVHATLVAHRQGRPVVAQILGPTRMMGDAGTEIELGSVELGGTLGIGFQLEYDDDHPRSGPVQLQLRFVNHAGEEWQRAVSVDVPPGPFVAIT